MTVKEKLRRYIQTRKTPVTAEQVAERMCCSRQTARAAMLALLKEGVVKEVLIAVKNKYVKGII
jgi:predicted ArsR family transcriptional regulator